MLTFINGSNVKAKFLITVTKIPHMTLTVANQSTEYNRASFFFYTFIFHTFSSFTHI